jgi:hypothetical protein
MIRTYSARQSAGLGCAERGPYADPGLMTLAPLPVRQPRPRLRAGGAGRAGEGPWAR